MYFFEPQKQNLSVSESILVQGGISASMWHFALFMINFLFISFKLSSRFMSQIRGAHYVLSFEEEGWGPFVFRLSSLCLNITKHYKYIYFGFP